ncbi:hypothetical protein J2Y57_003668, partial [Sphingomonas sp. BE137]|nr:hypothetical protein [Sphingomonas sp. BE137]
MTMPPSERLPSEQRALNLGLRGDRSLAATPTLFCLCAETDVNVAIPDVNRRRTGTPDRRPKGTPLWRWRASTLGAPFA